MCDLSEPGFRLEVIGMLFRAPYLGVNTTLMAWFRCFSLRLTDNLQDTARFIRTGSTGKESGGNRDHVDRCQHR